MFNGGYGVYCFYRGVVLLIVKVSTFLAAAPVGCDEVSKLPPQTTLVAEDNYAVQNLQLFLFIVENLQMMNSRTV